MDSDSRKATSGTVDDSSQALLQRSKLIRERWLELQAELQLGLRRAHGLVMSCQQRAKDVSGSLRTADGGYGSLASTKDIRPKLLARDAVVSHVLKRRPPNRLKEGPVVEPIRNELLLDAGALQEGRESLRQGGLAASDLNSETKRGDVTFLHTHHLYTSRLVEVNQPTCMTADKSPCTVLKMPNVKKKKASRPATEKRKRSKPLVTGHDGKTVGKRLAEAMEEKTKATGREYGEMDLVADCNAVVGRSRTDPPVVSQQMINQILRGEVDGARSSFVSVLAEAMTVRAVWLQHGWGKMKEEDTLARSLVELVRQHAKA